MRIFNFRMAVVLFSFGVFALSAAAPQMSGHRHRRWTRPPPRSCRK